MKRTNRLSRWGLLCSIVLPLLAQGQATLIATGAVWRYADKGSVPTSQTVAGQVRTWTHRDYDDTAPASWSAGASELGYGDGDEATVVGYGPDANAKYITTYFRKTISVSSVNATGYQVRVRRDDGVVLYLNDTEIWRDNLPTGAVSYATLASVGIGGADESAWSAWVSVPAALMQAGTNVLAAEVHQSVGNSSDITFDLELREAPAVTLTRGPYLNMTSQTAMTIRWRTDVPTIGRVTYGLVGSALTGTSSETATTIEHELRLTGLLTDQRYAYTVGTSTAVLRQGPDLTFQTAPPLNTKRKISIASFGDCGAGNANQLAVREAYLAFMASQPGGYVPADLWLLIGDNSYNGDDPTYQTKFFDVYRDNLLLNHPVYAIPGNHDYSDNAALAASHNIPYFDIFTHPTQAEAGGVASGTREWYSFDYGPVHVVMLDGYGTRLVNGVQKKLYDDTLSHPQAIWLKQDLAATTQPWRLVYLHFPPYTQGSHNSETEGDLIAIRQRLNPIFERYGVDVVMTGHSHVYERSYPIHDHYGPLSQFVANPTAYRREADASSGRYDGSANGGAGSCPYRKTNAKTKQSTIYVVSGSAGQLSAIGGLGNHPAMAFTQKQAGGSFYMTVEDNRLDARFIQTSSTASFSVTDQFTMMKNVGRTQYVPVSAGQSVTLTASFIADYQWSSPQSNTFTSAARSVVLTPAPGPVRAYVVRDSRQCLEDTYYVQVAYCSVRPGSWTDPGVWEGNRLPTAQDVVCLRHAVNIPANVQVTAAGVHYEAGGQLSPGSASRLLVSN
ncbi:metallophosphoesterase [Fibrella sp. WM1]|uniref:metallophosphoesterase n=1 Tax=Fibrella musci TaxID=3242485 RepID=UPI003522FB2F